MESQLERYRKSVKEHLFDPVDGASSVFFRVAFGLLLAKWAWDYLEMGRVRAFYIEPQFNFTYFGFDWVRPWPGDGMIIHFLVLIVLAICMAAGFLYRVSSLLFALGFTYVFLLDRTNYQNHYYLIALIAWWLPWLPLNRMVSVDAWLWPRLQCQSIPGWGLWMIRFHIFLPYFFGGIAKINADWLLGEPLRTMFLSQSDLPIIGWLFESELCVWLLGVLALIFDLAVVPLLLIKKTRVWAFVVCIIFHLMNSVIFHIHVFPWMMIAATPIFFEPNWPRRLLGGKPLHFEAMPTSSSTTLQKVISSVIFCYVVFHCTWPLRHHLYEGDASWTERGHYFAWRMMLRGKPVLLGYAIRDSQTGQVVDGTIQRYINLEQSEKFGRDPEMILHFAQFIGSKYKESTGHQCEVYALALASLNGRKPQLLIDPNVDLMGEPRGLYRRSWVLPQNEPLRRPAWDVPAAKWREHVDLPELKFLSKSGAIEPN
jgi:vitamin K-dependent gamma-carboxylase